SGLSCGWNTREPCWWRGRSSAAAGAEGWPATFAGGHWRSSRRPARDAGPSAPAPDSAPAPPPGPAEGAPRQRSSEPSLPAPGRTNRQVAARLFRSPKTVEANLARVYRKLGIRSRAELGARLAGAESEAL